MEKVNIIVGRFQPLTLGHLKCAKEVYDKFNIKTVFCVIKRDESKINSLQPFPYDMFELNLDGLSKEPYYENFVYITSANIGDIAKKCHEINADPVMWTCGTDRVYDYKRQIQQKYIDKFNLNPNIKIYEIKRTNEDISASQVREFLKNDDYKNFTKMVPKWLYPYFNKFKYMIKKHTNENNNTKRMKNIADLIKENMSNGMDTFSYDPISRTYNNNWGSFTDTHMKKINDNIRIITGSFFRNGAQFIDRWLTEINYSGALCVVNNQPMSIADWLDNINSDETQLIDSNGLIIYGSNIGDYADEDVISIVGNYVKDKDYVILYTLDN